MTPTWSRGSGGVCIPLFLAACTPEGGLGSLGTPPPDPLEIRTDIPDAERWIDLVALPCAVNALHEVTCWQSGPADLEWVDLRDLRVERLMLNFRPYLAGISAEGRHHVLACKAYDRDSTRPSRFCQSVDESLELAASWGGFTSAGGMVGPSQFLESVPPPRDWLLIGHDGYFAGIDTEHVVHLRDDPAAATRGWIDIPFQLRGEPVALAGAGGEHFWACVLDSTGEIVCETSAVFDAHMRFDRPPYRNLASAGTFACAQRVGDHVVECSDGTERPFGAPLQRLSLAAVGGINPFYNNPDYVVPVCGISYDNRILCDHPTYFTPETLQALEDLP